jgi:hypothetical protein
VNEEKDIVPDYTDLSCTDLMIRIIMRLKTAPLNSVVECIVRRDQRDSIEKPFSRKGYHVEIETVGTNLYRVRLKKILDNRVR